jgi:hypothetical protein
VSLEHYGTAVCYGGMTDVHEGKMKNEKGEIIDVSSDHTVSLNQTLSIVYRWQSRCFV